MEDEAHDMKGLTYNAYSPAAYCRWGEPRLTLMWGQVLQAQKLKDNMKHLRKLVAVLRLWTGSKVSDAGWSGSNSARNIFHLMCHAVPSVFSTFNRSLLFTCSLVMQLLELWPWRTKKMEEERKKRKRRINVGSSVRR